MPRARRSISSPPTAPACLDAVRFGDQENGVAFGRYPDGAPAFRRLSSITLGTNNARPRLSDVVINEIQYHPADGNDDEEFVELHNRGSSAVAAGQMALERRHQLYLPHEHLLAAGSYLVVARSVTSLLASHPGLNPALVLGDYSGKLANSGDVVRLDKPDDVVSTNQFGQLVTNKIHIIVDEANYRTGGRWGRWADGGGSSLERIDPRGDGNARAQLGGQR